MKKKKQTVNMRRILAATDGEVKWREAEMGGVAGCRGKYFVENKRDFKV